MSMSFKTLIKTIQTLSREAGGIGTTEKTLSTKHSFDIKSNGMQSHKKSVKMGATSTNAFPQITRKKNRKTHGKHGSLSNDEGVPQEVESCASALVSEEQNDLDLSPKYFDKAMRSSSQAQMTTFDDGVRKVIIARKQSKTNITAKTKLEINGIERSQ